MTGKAPRPTRPGVYDSGRSLPRSLIRFIRLVIPDRQAPHVLADLADEYAEVRHRRSAIRARWWLMCESASLLAAYTREATRRFRPSGSMWLRDLRLVGRALAQAPLAAAGAMALLSTGLLAMLVTAGLSEALLQRAVSVTHGDALRRIAAVDRHGRLLLRLSFMELEIIRSHIAETGLVTAINMQPAVVRARGVIRQTMAEVVDRDYFAAIGTTMALGRPILAADDRPGAPPVAILSTPFWHERFGGSPDALGQIIEINGSAYTVAGVSAAIGSSSAFGGSVDVWVPLAHADPVLGRGWRTDVSNRWFTAFVLPSTTGPEIEGRLVAAAAELARQHPEPWRDRRLQTAMASVLTGQPRITARLLTSVLVGLALLILATAAANLGGVFLARAAATRRQAAIHLAMGAGRGAVVRRHLIEGAVLGLGGAVIALATYVWVRTRLAEVALLPTLALRLELRLDAVVVGLLAIAGMVAGMLLAAGPALWSARVELTGAMRDCDARTTGGSGLTRLRRALVGAEVALALALMVGAVLFNRSLAALSEADLGFSREQLVAMDFDLEPAGATASALPQLARDALDRAQRTPGIIAAAMSNRAPVDPSTPGVDIHKPGDAPTVIADVTFNLATADYFATVGVPIVAGRPFTIGEAESGADVAIVNQTLASRLWPDGDVLNRALTLPREKRTLRVIGVAADARYRSIAESGRPHLYRPTPATLGLTLLARTAGDPRSALAALQSSLDEVGPGVIGFFPRTMPDHLEVELLPTRAAAAAASVLSGIAVVLSGVGLYGLVAWFVARRRREIGIRLALGATPRDVRRLVVADTLRTVLPGVAGGMALAAGCATLARSALYGVGPIDPTAFAAAVLALSGVVALASYLPARRATRVDPVVVLKEH